MIQPVIYSPNFTCVCHICGHSPTVVVKGHIQPETELCGPHMFNDREMVDWSLWNEDRDDTD